MNCNSALNSSAPGENRRLIVASLYRSNIDNNGPIIGPTNMEASQPNKDRVLLYLIEGARNIPRTNVFGPHSKKCRPGPTMVYF